MPRPGTLPTTGGRLSRRKGLFERRADGRRYLTGDEVLQPDDSSAEAGHLRLGKRLAELLRERPLCTLWRRGGESGVRAYQSPF